MFHRPGAGSLARWNSLHSRDSRVSRFGNVMSPVRQQVDGVVPRLNVRMRVQASGLYCPNLENHRE